MTMCFVIASRLLQPLANIIKSPPLLAAIRTKAMGGTFVCVCLSGLGKEDQNIKKGEKQGKAIISHRRTVHTFHISQFLC